jgi:dihydrofolate synthase / folylpolyglutamate synthase
MIKMNYEETLSYLDLLQPKSFRMELGPLTEVAGLMGSPQKSLNAIHISGTNGKGSTAAFLSSILKGSGQRVGLFTSPHLLDVRERIQVSGKKISKELLADTVTRIRDVLPDDRMLSFFEILTLAAMIYFNEGDVDVSIFETGLGGRLDATNIIQPKVSVITPISFDHVRHLGHSLKDIAEEKCGIIKRGVPTVVAYQPPDVMNVIRRCCDDIGSPLCLATPDEVNVPLGLDGEHQRQNAACAVEAAHLLAQSGITLVKVDEALASTKWPGRMETVSTSPRVILDGAHNVAGAEALASYVRSELKHDKSVLVLGVLSDKDVAGIIRPLAPLFREVICVRAPSQRAASPKDLAAAVRSSGSKVEVQDDVPSALKATLARLADDDTLVVAGSLAVIGEAEEYFTKK